MRRDASAGGDRLIGGLRVRSSCRANRGGVAGVPRKPGGARDRDRAPRRRARTGRDGSSRPPAAAPGRPDPGLPSSGSGMSPPVQRAGTGWGDTPPGHPAKLRARRCRAPPRERSGLRREPVPRPQGQARPSPRAQAGAVTQRRAVPTGCPGRKVEPARADEAARVALPVPSWQRACAVVGDGSGSRIGRSLCRAQRDIRLPGSEPRMLRPCEEDRA